MKSMTGFGRSAFSLDEGSLVFRAEVSSVNKRNLEVRCVLARELCCQEALIRQVVGERLTRGMVSVKVELECGGAADKLTRINKTLVRHLARELARLGEELELPGKVAISDLLSIPGVVETLCADSADPQFELGLRQTLGLALDGLEEMRVAEGGAIAADLRRRFTNLREMLERIEPFATSLPEQRVERLRQKLREGGVDTGAEDDSLRRELVYIADRMDVSEEITRLKSHFAQFEGYLNDESQPVGRQLDFLLMEMLREITTLGNKAGQQDIAVLVVEFKSELERVREQTKNVE